MRKTRLKETQLLC